MNLDQQLRTDLRTAVEHIPGRHGSLDDVVTAGDRRRTVTRFSRLATAAIVVVVVGAGTAALLGRSVPGRVAAGPDVSTIDIGGFEVGVDGLVPGFEEQQLYRAEPGPTPTFPTGPHGPEQPLEPATPPAVGLGAAGESSIYLGNFPLIPGSAFLYTDNDGLACIWLERQPGETGYEWCLNTAYERAGALHWMIEPASSNPADGATVVVAWYGLPPHTSIVAATVDGNPVGLQRVTSGAVVLTVPVDLGADLVLIALDASGTMIDFGRDDNGVLILGEQRFDNLTFDGIGE